MRAGTKPPTSVLKPLPTSRILSTVNLARAAIFCPVVLAACILTPENHDEVGPDGVVSFWGFGTAPAQTFILQSSATQSGPFTTIATVSTETVANDFRGIDLYEWQTEAAVTTWTDLGGCAQEAFVRGRVGSYNALTFEQDGLTCILTDYFGGNDIVNATIGCQSPDAPIARITRTATTTHVGNLVVSTQVQADSFACVAVIDGSLTVADDPSELSITLPNLVEVTGDVDVVISRDPAANYFYPPMRSIDAPLLATIGGSLDVDVLGNTGDILDVDLGLEALTSLGGGVDVSITTFNVDLAGLDNLSSVPGDLSVVSSGDDFTSFGWLGGLTNVGGSLYVEAGHTAVGVYSDLQDVGGDLTVNGPLFPPGTSNFADLLTVGGDLVIQNAEVVGFSGSAPHLPSLSTVAGALVLDGVGQLEWVAIGDQAGGLDVGSIDFDATGLQELTPSHIVVAPTGGIAVTNHNALTSCEVDDFATEQMTLGWSGTLVNTGNGSC